MKRIIIVALIIISIFSFVGCNNSSTFSEETTTILETTTEKPGSYHVFKTIYEDKYTDFLNNFDNLKYEIVDISTGYDSTYVDYYVITYRVK